MSRRAAAFALAGVLVLAACGGADEGGEVEVPDVAEDTADAAEDSGATVLLGGVGTPEDPDAYEIWLTDEDGEPVTELPAGDYVIQVSDPSDVHNFHLRGGTVDEKSSVPDAEDVVFELTLDAGTYTYTCDPHPSMTGTITVT